MKYEITKEQILSIHSDGCTYVKEWFPEAFETVLEAGKWYKCIEKGFESLVCITDFENCKAYGFTYYGKNCKNKWVDNDNRGWTFKSDTKNWIQATESEVFEALKNEAVRRGVKLGIAISRSFDKDLVTAIINKNDWQNDSDWYYNLENDYLEHHGFVVYSKGKWAEIIPTITKEEAEKLLNKKIV